jgi:hypothetical protein
MRHPIIAAGGFVLPAILVADLLDPIPEYSPCHHAVMKFRARPK